MRKIYNEVVIDMNPESSSYGDTLYEDSFEYEGQMALAGAVDDRIRATSGYEEHRWMSGLPSMKRTGPEGVQEIWIYNKDATEVLQTIPYTSGHAWSMAQNRAKDWSTRLGTEAAAGYVEPSQKVAPDINYSDIQRFIDPLTGEVSDLDGMVNYLRTMPGMPQDQSTLEALIADMPNLKIGQGELAQAKSKKTSDIYGIQSGMMKERGQESAAAGASGVYSPTSSGFGGGDTSNVYGQLGAISSQGDMYGLGGDKEEEFANWLQSQVGGE